MHGIITKENKSKTSQWILKKSVYTVKLGLEVNLNG